MSLPLARLNDLVTGICSAHPHGPIPAVGYIASASATVTAEGLPVARLGDTVITACGHSGLIASGSATVTAEGAPVARVGDTVSGAVTGQIGAGAARTLSG